MSKTLEELGYEKEEYSNAICYKNYIVDKEIRFYTEDKEIIIGDFGDYHEPAESINVEELKAIYKYCEDLGWI